MQDDVNVPGCPLAVGFTLEKLSAHTIDEAGKEVFVHKNALELLRKVRRCEGRLQLGALGTGCIGGASVHASAVKEPSPAACRLPS
jgi:Vacuolar sorting-associated protein 13, N-terminal